MPLRLPAQEFDAVRLAEAGCTAQTIDHLRQLCQNWAKRPLLPLHSVKGRNDQVTAIRAAAVEMQAKLAALTGSEYLSIVVRSGVIRAGSLERLIEACDESLSALAAERVQTNRPDGRYLFAFVASVAGIVAADDIRLAANPTGPFMNIMDVCLCAAGVVPQGTAAPDVEHVVRDILARRPQSHPAVD